MDYLYENLGDERFQELCSILISKEFPNIQSYPVGQPDGGRDSIVYFMDSNNKDFIVFQVKFVRNANEERDVHKWLIETIDKEVDKIEKLIPKGAKSYYLMTNVRGTAHLDSGSKDKVNKILEERINIPSICWWRDDISTMFEKDPLFKWSFPQILNGQDILNSVLFNQLYENKERRESVIRSYLTDQFETDNEVKFKQIDLHNKLLDLFTDVPIRAKKINTKNKFLKQTLSYLGQNHINDDIYYNNDSKGWGAAEFILHPKVQNEIERILLEGGPGQGKSTISQYICQVHRVRLLNKLSDINSLPDNIKDTPIRLPFKIDLRDIASWVEKENPYKNILSDEYFNENWANSLESFLVSHIFYHSKLKEFNSTDYIAICKLSPILFVFDGFDEIANIKVRGQVIDFINKGVSRISINAKSIQIIITSRPAAFNDSVGFSIDNYPHFELTDITSTIINEYVEKWIKASKLTERDANELRKLIVDKLDMPHLKDLAKSPMQLAIFISLLRTKGQSLPNKRTSLYDNYIELFFDRESEKNDLIRDKRDLIIDIHEYLAWILHSEAELLNNNGSIQIDDLTSRLKEYLSNEGHETSIADDLFDVMKERVCALVSRVQGTFEFEVQPLREYFCAKYLYKSAPHSSAGSVMTGSKPDRFSAILRNFYWQNVVRFFAGCADAGELDMIIHELKELQNDEQLKFTNYPRIITSQILSDYVFTQKPLKLKNVVKIIVDGINIGNIINQSNRSNEPLLLPNDCGRKEVISECFEQLLKLPKNDYTSELISIIRNNPFQNLERWIGFSPLFKGVGLTKWLRHGYRIGIIYKIEENILFQILEEGDSTETLKRLQLLINGNRIDIINKNIKYKEIVFSNILNSDINAININGELQSLNFLSVILHPIILIFTLTKDMNQGTLANHIRSFLYRNKVERLNRDFFAFEVNDSIDEKIEHFKNSMHELLNLSTSEYRKSLKPWDMFVEKIRTAFPENRISIIIATFAAGVKTTEKTVDEYYELSDDSISLYKRIRYARMKSGNIKYWNYHLLNNKDILSTCLVFFTWATPKTIIQLIPVISQIITNLNSNEFSILIKDLSITCILSKFTKNQQLEINTLITNKKCSDEIKYILSNRFEISVREKIIYDNIKNNNERLEKINEIKFEYLVSKYLSNPKNEEILMEIKVIYNEIYFYEEKQYYRYNHNNSTKIPYELAKKIMLDCKDYPRIISSLAEKTCRLYASKNVKPIGEIALSEKWFV